MPVLYSRLSHPAHRTFSSPFCTHGHLLQSQEEDRSPRLGRKRARQDVKLNAHNSSLRSKFRTVVKNVQKAVTGRRQGQGRRSVQVGQSVIDSIADKGLFHKNKAARHKSRLAAKVKALSSLPRRGSQRQPTVWAGGDTRPASSGLFA
jgi:small subunit ribosomal protein S20